MSLWEIILMLVIAGVCGSIAQSIAGFSRGGCLLSIVIGFIGAVIGTWLARKFGLPEFLTLHIGGKSFPVVWSIIGAVIFSVLLGAVSPRGKR